MISDVARRILSEERKKLIIGISQKKKLVFGLRKVVTEKQNELNHLEGSLVELVNQKKAVDADIGPDRTREVT